MNPLHAARRIAAWAARIDVTAHLAAIAAAISAAEPEPPEAYGACTWDEPATPVAEPAESEQPARPRFDTRTFWADATDDSINRQWDRMALRLIVGDHATAQQRQ
jgi:hypothetical protein